MIDWTKFDYLALAKTLTWRSEIAPPGPDGELLQAFTGDGTLNGTPVRMLIAFLLNETHRSNWPGGMLAFGSSIIVIPPKARGEIYDWVNEKTKGKG